MTLEHTTLIAANGASARIHLQGAHVTSWRPAPGDDERLFLSSLSEYGAGVAIRGGIPVIFPQFAGEGPLPRHGFARTMPWTLVRQERNPDGSAAATLILASSPETRTVWPAEFLATMEVRVEEQRLTTAFSVENTGNAPFTFAAALHTYLRVHDARNASLVGLHGARYRVSGAPTRMIFDDAESLYADEEIDRVYVGAPARLTLREPSRQLAIEMEGFTDTVVWNPGARAADMTDMEPGGEHRMLCVESALVQTPLMLDAGRRWSGLQRLIAQPLESQWRELDE